MVSGRMLAETPVIQKALSNSHVSNSSDQALYYDKATVLTMFPAGSWQRVVFAEFAATLGSEMRPFPCVFGVQGLRDDQLRYVFLDGFVVARLGLALTAFVANCRDYGANTSLVVFTRPEPVRGMESYRKIFWRILDGLARIDHARWPAGIPDRMSDAAWEFCFAGEPIFVVCNTPAHVARQSRRSSSLTLTFQPRWVFAKILATERSAGIAFGKVRDRLSPFDMLSPSPDLGRYGDHTKREYQQYFLADRNETAACPFAKLGQTPTELN